MNLGTFGHHFAYQITPTHTNTLEVHYEVVVAYIPWVQDTATNFLESLARKLSCEVNKYDFAKNKSLEYNMFSKASKKRI
jgi:hypothetical protein